MSIIWSKAAFLASNFGFYGFYVWTSVWVKGVSPSTAIFWKVLVVGGQYWGAGICISGVLKKRNYQVQVLVLVWSGYQRIHMTALRTFFHFMIIFGTRIGFIWLSATIFYHAFG